MKREGHYLLIYDISSDKLRNAVAKVVEGYGIRVQRSAFECRLTRGMKERLWQALQESTLEAGDGIRLYSLGSGKMRHLGDPSAQSHPLAEDKHVIIL